MFFFYFCFFFFFQAEDGIRDFHVTGVQTCALPIFPATSVPSNRSIATIPVGEVTLISVSHSPPITSIPTNSSPRRLSSGPSAAQISRSRGVSSVFSADPPTARLLRNSPSLGSRLIA